MYSDRSKRKNGYIFTVESQIQLVRLLSVHLTFNWGKTIDYPPLSLF